MTHNPHTVKTIKVCGHDMRLVIMKDPPGFTIVSRYEDPDHGTSLSGAHYDGTKFVTMPPLPLGPLAKWVV